MAGDFLRPRRGTDSGRPRHPLHTNGRNVTARKEFSPMSPQMENTMIKRVAMVLIVSTAICAPAMAEEVGVGVGPVGVTVGSGPDRVVREKEVVREREPSKK